jgi:N-acetyl-1-D-myo-inositol-2-amino-2-deoxy-alpha-D-glucopyranoside deacetylase
MVRPSLLAFFAHPDDEALTCGGTLAAAASLGIETLVVCATRGEGGLGLDGMTGSALAEVRTAELERSCEILGAGPPRFLDLPDGALGQHRDALAAAIAKVLHEVAPSVAITMGQDGAYGHPDHVACSEALDSAAEGIDDPPTVLHAVFPEGVFQALRRRLARTPVALMPAVEVLPADRRVDTRRFDATKLDAIRAHASQLRGVDPRDFLVSGLVDRLLGEERYRHVSGPALRGALARLIEAL